MKSHFPLDTVNAMSLQKTALFFALFGAGMPLFAAESPSTAASAAPIENYTYATKLDIQKVVGTSEIPDQCGAVPVRMTYEDSHGQQHTLQYLVMGQCSNG